MSSFNAARSMAKLFSCRTATESLSENPHPRRLTRGAQRDYRRHASTTLIIWFVGTLTRSKAFRFSFAWSGCSHHTLLMPLRALAMPFQTRSAPCHSAPTALASNTRSRLLTFLLILQRVDQLKCGARLDVSALPEVLCVRNEPNTIGERERRALLCGLFAKNGDTLRRVGDAVCSKSA